MENQESEVDRATRMMKLELECELLFEEKVKLERRVMEVEDQEQRMKAKYLKWKGRYAEMEEKFDSEKRTWREEDHKKRNNYSQLNMEKRLLAIDLNGALSKIEDLDRHNNRLERVFEDRMAIKAKMTKMKEEENSKLIQKIQDLERDKEQLVAQVSKLEKEKSEEVEKSFNVKKALGAEKKRSEEVETMNLELVKNIGALERAMEAIQDGVSKLNREKMPFEEENKKSGVVLIKRIEALEKNAKEMEAKLSQTNMEKDAEIMSIVTEKMALKDQGEKTSEAQKKELEPKDTGLVSKRREVAHLVSNSASTLDTLAAQTQGIINIEEQTALARVRAHKCIQLPPLSEVLTGGGSGSNSSVALHHIATRKRTRSGGVKKL